MISRRTQFWGLTAITVATIGGLFVLAPPSRQLEPFESWELGGGISHREIIGTNGKTTNGSMPFGLKWFATIENWIGFGKTPAAVVGASPESVVEYYFGQLRNVSSGNQVDQVIANMQKSGVATAEFVREMHMPMNSLGTTLSYTLPKLERIVRAKGDPAMVTVYATSTVTNSSTSRTTSEHMAWTLIRSGRIWMAEHVMVMKG